MKRFFVLVLMISAGVSSACANLGDGSDRIDDSYGKLVERHLRDDGTVSTLYHKDRYLYFVIFDNRVSVFERYRKIPKGQCRPSGDVGPGRDRHVERTQIRAQRSQSRSNVPQSG